MNRAKADNSDSESGFLTAAIRGWNRFWFNPADPTPLGVIRILCGLMVLYVHLAYSYDLMSFHGPHAWIDARIMDEFRNEAPIVGPTFSWEEPLPPPTTSPEDVDYAKKWGMLRSQAFAIGHPLFSIWFHVTDPTWMWICHGAMLLIMLAFTVGFCTRVTAVLTWLSILSYIQRAQTSLFGMDTIMNLTVFYLMIGPSGAALSVDRLLSRYWQTRRIREKGDVLPPSDAPSPSVTANLAIRLLQVHVCFVYCASGLSKLQGQAWWSGTAPWSTMANYEFSPMYLQYYMNSIHFLVNHRWLWELMMSSIAIFTLVFEVGFPIFMLLAYLVKKPWGRSLRWFVIGAAVLLHLGIAVFMGLVTFSLMMLVAVCAFVPAEAWHRLFERLHLEDGRIRLAYVEGKAA
jgi:hypothetical protein